MIQKKNELDEANKSILEDIKGFIAERKSDQQLIAAKSTIFSNIHSAQEKEIQMLQNETKTMISTINNQFGDLSRNISEMRDTSKAIVPVKLGFDIDHFKLTSEESRHSSSIIMNEMNQSISMIQSKTREAISNIIARRKHIEDSDRAI